MALDLNVRLDYKNICYLQQSLILLQHLLNFLNLSRQICNKC